MKTVIASVAKKTQPRAAKTNRFSIGTILVATDFSPTSIKALQYAQALAHEFQAALHLVNVLDVQFETPTLAPLYLTDAEVERRLRQRLHDIATIYAEPIRKGRCHARQGRACDEVGRVARRIKADLIVIATRGYSGFKHMVMGSTTERIIRHADRPVLIVREKEREFVSNRNGKAGTSRTAFHLKNILVPTDFSEHSRAALTYAIAVAKHFGAKVTLMNVIHPQSLRHQSGYQRGRLRDPARFHPRHGAR